MFNVWHQVSRLHEWYCWWLQLLRMRRGCSLQRSGPSRSSLQYLQCLQCPAPRTAAPRPPPARCCPPPSAAPPRGRYPALNISSCHVSKWWLYCQLTCVEAVGDDVGEGVCGAEGAWAAVGVGHQHVALQVAALLSVGGAAAEHRVLVTESFPGTQYSWFNKEKNAR